MKNLIPFILVFLFISCEKKEDNPFGLVDKAPLASECSSSTSFSGITSITDIKDSSVQLNWTSDGSGIGYGIFKNNGSSLELISSEAKNKSSYIVTGLTSETSYEFIVRKLSGSAVYDCNENYETALTTVKSTFSSCYEMYNFYAGVVTSGYYEIDADLTGPDAPFNVYCEMDENSGGWTRVLYHDVTEGAFANTTDAAERNLSDPSNGRYSILSKLPNFVRTGKYEFWLSYPGVDGASGGNIWTQTSNPTAGTTITGYIPVSIDNTSQGWNGIARSSTTSTYLDGTPGNGNWWYAIGSNTLYQSATTVPGPGVIVNEVVLYIR